MGSSPWPHPLSSALLLAFAALFLSAPSLAAPPSIDAVSPPRLCVVVNYHTATLPAPDGLDANAARAAEERWNGLAWARDACVQHQGGSFSFADDDWQPRSSLALAADFARLQGLTASGGRVRRTITARLSADGQRLDLLNITIEFGLAVKSASAGANLYGVVSKSIVGGLPLEAAASFPVHWYGDLRGGGGKLGLYDSDLFDGTNPAVVDSTVKPPGDTTGLLAIADIVRDVAGSPALRQVLFDVLPSTLTESTRGAFLNASAFADLVLDDVVVGSIQSSVSTASVIGVLLQDRIECRGVVCEGLPFADALQQIVASAGASKGGLCSAPVLLTESLRASHSVDIVVGYLSPSVTDLTQAYVRARGMGSRSEATFRCDAEGASYVSIALSVSAPLDDAAAYWPLAALTEQRTAVSMVRAIPVIARGCMVGNLNVILAPDDGEETASDAFYSVVPFDLFSADGGGLLLPDHQLSNPDLTATVTSLFTAIQNRLATSEPLFDSLVADLFPSDVTALVDAYMGQTLVPSFFGFLHFAAQTQSDELQVFMSLDGLTATLAIDMARPRIRLSSSSDVGVSAIVSQANAAVSTLRAAVVERFGSLSGYEVPRVPEEPSASDIELARFFTAVVSINCTLLFDNGNKTESVNVVAAPRLVALASVQAQFNASDPTLLFSGFTVTYDVVAGTTMTTATAGFAAASVMGATVGLTREGLLATEGTWDNPSALRASIESISQSIAQVDWARGNLELVIDLDFAEMARGVRLDDMLSELASGSVIGSTQSISAWTLAGLLQEAIASYAADDGTVIVDVSVVPLVNSQTMDVTLIAHSQRRLQLATAGTTWDSTTDLARLAIPTALTTTLRFTVSPSKFNTSEFSVRGGGELHGWVIPFTYGMLAGTVTGDASAALMINLPASAQFRVSMIVTSEQLELHAQIADENIVDPARAVLVVTSAEDGIDARLGTPTITSSRVMSALSEVILPALPQAFSGTLNVPIPPFAKPLGSITQFSRLLAIIKPWLGSMPKSANTGQLVQSATFCTGMPAGTAPFTLNVTVNSQAMVTCRASGPLAPTSVEALRDDITALLADCHLDSFITAGIMLRQTQPDGRECGRIGLFPAVPGIIWSFGIATASVGGNVSLSGKWITSPKPAFGTWLDFARLLAAIFVYDNDPLGSSTAEWTTVNASLVVPPELAAFYPTELLAISVHLEADHAADDISFVLQPHISASDGMIQLQAHNTTGVGSVASTLTADMLTIFGGPPLGGRGNISLSTCFDGVNMTANSTLVPPSPNNTFVLVFGAQVLSDTFRPEWLSMQQLIVLPEGKLLSAALIDDVIPQINATLQPMLAIYEVPADKVVHPANQIRFDFGRRQLPDGRWILPTSFGLLASSSLPAITNATNVPPQTVIMARNLSMTLETEVEAVQTDRNGQRIPGGGDPTAQGRIGIMAFTAARQRTRSRMAITITGASEYQTLTSLYPSRINFFDSFAVDIAVNNTAAVTGINMPEVHAAAGPHKAMAASNGLMSNNISTPGVTFGQVGRYAVESLESLKNLTQRLSSWKSSFNGTRRAMDTFRGLLLTNNSICSWIDLADGMAALLVETPLVDQQIPFVHRSFGSVLNSNLVDSLDSLQSSVCGAHEPFSLATFCDLIQTAFSGTTASCANITLSDWGLAFDILVEPFSRTYVDQVRFDAPSLFDAGDLPIGLGDAGEVAISVAFDFRLRLLARFGQNGKLVTFSLDHEATSFSVAVELDLQGTIQASFGPVSLPLSNSHLWVGHPARLIVRLPVPAPNASLEHGPTQNAVQLRNGTFPPTGLEIDLVGSAGLRVEVGFNTHVQCVINVAVDDIKAFLGGRMPNVTQHNCGKGFALELLDLLGQQPLLDSFGLGFVDQWESGLAQFIDLFLGALNSAAELPLVGKLVSALVTDGLGQLSGADAVNSLTRAINTMTDNLRHGHYPTELAMEQKMLELFTDALSFEFRFLLAKRPAVPKVSDPEFVWPLHFRTANKLALPHLGFDLGNHGPATLALQCDADLQMEWDLVMNLVFNRSHGFDFRFETSPMFDADVLLEVDDGCDLSGTLGWIGADLVLHERRLLEAKLTVDKNLQIDFTASARVIGTAELGLGGELAELVAKAPDALDALPHWRATLNLTWDWDMYSNQDLVPHFGLSDVQFCIGRLLTNVIGSTVSQTIDKLLHPLDPVFGADGILLKPVPGLSGIFGNNMNLAQLLIFACQASTECEVGGLLEMLQTFAQVFRDVESLADITAMLGGEGCNIVQLARNFTVDFRQAHPQPTFSGEEPPEGLQYKGAANDNDQLKDAAGAFHHSVTTKGKFGVKLYIFDDLPGTMISALTGKDFALAGVTLPDVTFFVGMEWPILVWDPPQVEIIVGVNARLTLAFGGVALMYSGLAEAVKTKSPGVLFAALALPTKNDDGSVRWPVQAAIGLYGGVSIDVFIFRAETYLTVTLEGDVGFVDLDNDGWVTFNEMAFLTKLNGPGGAIRFRIILTLGFGIKIQTCIDLFAVRYCYTWTDQHWDHSWTLLDTSYNVLDSLAVSSGGQTSINLALVNFGGGKRSLPALGCDSCEEGLQDDGSYANGSSLAFGSADVFARAVDGELRFSLLQTPSGLTVDFTPAGVDSFGGAPHMSRGKLAASQAIVTHGDPGGTPFTWAVGYVTQLVVLPAYDTVTLKYEVSAYRNVSVIAVSPQAVTPNSVPGVTITRCAQLHFTRPKVGITFKLWGVPCPLLLESAVATNISLAGVLADYKHPITIKGEAWGVTSTIAASAFNISKAGIFATDGDLTAQIALPPVYKTLSLQGDLTRSVVFTISDVAAGVSLRLTGGSLHDEFIVPDMRRLYGSTLINGGSGDDVADITFITRPGVDMIVTAGPMGAVMQDGIGQVNASANSTTLRHTSIARRTYVIKGAPNTMSNVTLLRFDRDDSVSVVAHGAPGGTIVQRITSCDGKSELRVTFKDGGYHEVRIGNNNQVTGMHCTVWLNAMANETLVVNVIIEASAETRPLQYDIQNDAILIYDVNNDGSFFHLMFSQVSRVQVQFGIGGSVLRMAEGTTGTEYFFDFSATNGTNATGTPTNIANIGATNSPLLLVGHITEVNVGPKQSKIGDAPPLQTILAPVAIAQRERNKTADDASASVQATTTVRLASGSGKQAPAQQYYLDDACLSAQDLSDGVMRPARLSVLPSAWLCDLMTAHGLAADACTNPCPVVYSGAINVSILTGWADDSFYGFNVSVASVAVNLGPGADNVTWFAAPSSESDGNQPTARFDLGPGADSVFLASPMGNATVLLGRDTDVDIIAFYYGGLPLTPSVYNNVVASVGPDGAALTLKQVSAEDLLFIYGGHLTADSTHAAVASEAATAEADLASGGTTQKRVVVIHVNVPGQVINMDVQSNVTYRVIGSAQLATVNLNGQGRKQPPFPAASDWDVVVDIPPSAQIGVNVLAAAGSRATMMVNVTGDQAQSVVLESLDSRGLCRTTVGLLEVRTMHVDHIKIDAQCAVDVHVRGTASAELVILTPDAVDHGAEGSRVHLENVEGATLVVNATVTLSGQAVLANHTVVVVGPRSEMAVIGYTFAGVSFDDGCLLGAGFAPPSTVFSNWFDKEAADVGVNDTTDAAECSLYAHHVDRLNLTTTTLYVGRLGAERVIRRLVLKQVPAVVTIDNTGAPAWTSATVAGSVLGVDGRFEVDLEAGGRLTLTTPVFGGSNVSSLDIYASSAGSWSNSTTPAPLCQWFFGTRSGGVVPDGATLLMNSVDDHKALAVIYASSLLEPRHLPLVRLHGPVRLTAQLHNLTADSTRDIIVEPSALRVYETPVSTWLHTATTPLVAVEWVTSSVIQGSLRVELADGDNRVEFKGSMAQFKAAPFGVPVLKVDEPAVATLNPPYDAQAPSINMLHTAGMLADLASQFLHPQGGGSDSVYCFQPNEQCSANAWLWLTVRIAPWLEPELACRSVDALIECQSQLFASLDVASTHSLRAVLFPDPSVPPSPLPSPPAHSPSPSQVPPSLLPSQVPSQMPSQTASTLPSQTPSNGTSATPSQMPSQTASTLPSQVTSPVPSQTPSNGTSQTPSELPSLMPSHTPSNGTSATPSQLPSRTTSPLPSQTPSNGISQTPSELPSSMPSHTPSQLPSLTTSPLPSQVPSQLPSPVASSQVPSQTPSESPVARLRRHALAGALSQQGDAMPSVPFTLHIAVYGSGDAANALIEAAPDQRGYAVSVIVMFTVMTVCGFGWWIITGSVIPTGWGTFIITASLAGLLDASSSWDPRVVAIIEGTYWITATFASGCKELGTFHICVLMFFVVGSLLAVPSLFSKRIRKITPMLQRTLIAATAVTLPFVIIQAPGHDGSMAWAFFTAFAALCGLAVLASYYFHTFKAMPSRNRRYFGLLPAILMSIVVVVMSCLARLRDEAGMPRGLFYVAALAALAIDCSASLSSMLVLISLVKGWWRVSPVIIAGVAMFFSVACGLTFIIAVEASNAGGLALVTWYLWLLLPSAAAAIIMCLPYPVIAKTPGRSIATRRSAPREQSAEDTYTESERPLLSLNRTTGTFSAAIDTADDTYHEQTEVATPHESPRDLSSSL